ncbi:MAG: hypothetical protein ACKVQW_03410 [Pyrinomonadaceae bacterium]
MKDVIKRKLDKFEREATFMVDNAADFPAATPGATAAAALSVVIAEIRDLAAEQVSGASTAAQAFGNQEESLDDLIGLIKKMNLAARGFDDEIPGSRDQFRMPRNRSQQNILAVARAFHSDATPISAKFQEYGLVPTFLDDLQAAIQSVATAAQSADSNLEQRAAATGGLFDMARRGMGLSRKLNSIVRIKYTDNPAKLAAWTLASHLERAPKRVAAQQAPNP